jgi:hypothetical protein
MNKIFSLFKYLFCLFLFITFLKTINIYPGNKFIYLLFSIISIFHLFYGLRKGSYFVDKFIALFFWLGFWFKFSFEFAYSLFGAVNFREGIGLFEKTPVGYDNVLLISSVGIAAFIFTSFISKLVFSTHEVSFKDATNLFYNNNKKIIYFIFYFVVFLVSITNVYYGIYQKGLIPNQNFSIYISYLFRWLLLFGFTSFACILIYFEIGNKTINYKLIYLLFFESFISNISLLSRSAIFNLISLIYGLSNYLDKKILKKKFIFVLIIFSFVLFFLNVLSVNKMRDLEYYYEKKISKIYDILKFAEPKKEFESLIVTNSSVDDLGNLFAKKTFKEINIFDLISPSNNNFFTSNIYDILYLLTNRWVGIDAVMAVYSQKDDLNFDLIRQSLDEKFKENSYSFFEKKFLKRSNENFDKTLVNSNAVIIPGLIGYLYFSGSKVFLFFSIFIVVFLCQIFERLSYKVSKKNIIFTSFMGYILASRLAHSGYLVSNNITYVIALLLNLFVVYLMVMILHKLNKN